jgi:hypothetical protein
VRADEAIGETAGEHLPRSGERLPLHVRLERQRGLKSFLTWAFFLAQVSAAEQLLTGAAKAQDDEFSDNPAKPPEESPPDPLAENAIQKHGGGPGADAMTSSGSGSSTLHQPSLEDGTLPHAHPHLLSPAAGTPPHKVGVASGGAESGASAHARVGSSGSPDSSPSGLLPDLHVDQTAPALVQADGDVGSLLGFELNIGDDGLIGIDLDLGNLVGTLDNLLTTPVQEVTELVGSLTNDLGNLLNGAGLALGEVLDSTGEGLGEVLDSTGEVLGSALDLSELTGLNLTDGLSGLLGQDSTESPEQDDETAPSATETQTDELFVGGQYTNYNIALREGAEPAADTTPLIELNIGDSPPNEPASEPAQADQPPSDQPPPDSVIADLLRFDEFETRPSV